MKARKSSSCPNLWVWAFLPIFYLIVLAITSLKLWTIIEDYQQGNVIISLEPNAPIQQTIIPSYPGLFRIDIYLRKERPQLDGFVYLSVSMPEKPEISINYSHPPASTSQYAMDGNYPFMFPAIINAAAQSMVVTLATTEGASMSTLGASTDTYPSGQILSPSGLAVQDISFKLYYRPGIFYSLRNVSLIEALSQLLGYGGLYQSEDGAKVIAFLTLVTVSYWVIVVVFRAQLEETP